ncbi:MAG TPA: YlxM family DNA-binding protein [Clostridiaceae bacterium]|nr:YlxM family DNA-binding protein [Clostridiaceae bacterium]
MAEAALMLDFYGALLTPRSVETMSLYYNEDLSLAEIAYHFDISRQSVHDTLKRGRRQLLDYESKLGLVAKARCRRSCIEQINSALLAGDIDQVYIHLQHMAELE